MIYRKVYDHCHYTAKYRGAGHSTDCGEFKCLGENIEK